MMASQGLTRRQVEYFALGGTLGVGIFLGVGRGIHIAGPVLIVAYALVGAVVYFLTRCLGEIALNDPAGGTFVSYARRYLGPHAAFVQGWAYWFAAVLVGMAELTAVGLLLHQWMPGVPQWVPALLALAGLCAINCLSVRVFGEIEFGMAMIKIAVLSIFLLLGVAILLAPHAFAMDQAGLSNLWRHGGFAPLGLKGFLAGLPVALFAFGGAELVCLAAAETDDPARNLPRAIRGLLLRLLLFYMGITLMIICLMPWSSVPTDSSPVVAVFAQVGVPAAATLMNGVLISVLLSSCNSLQFGAARVLKSLAQERCAPAALAELNRRGAPNRAVAASLMVTSLAIVLNYFIPQQVFGLLMNCAALTAVVVWASFMVVHLRFRAAWGAPGAIYAVPFAPWTNYLVLAFIASVLAILAFDAEFRPAYACALGLYAVLAAAAMAWQQNLKRAVELSGRG